MHCLGFCFSQWCSLFVMLGVLIVLNIGQTEETFDNRDAVREAYVNVGDDARLVFLGYGTEIRHRGCDVSRYEILVRERNHSKRIFASNSGYGTIASCVGDCNIYSNRGRILDDTKNVVFTLVNTRKSDKKSYCLRILCSGSDDINSNCEKAGEISLMIVDPVTRLNHTMTGSCPVIKLNDTIQLQGICYADGDPPPDMKIINNNTGEVMKEGRTNNLSYSFHIKERQRQVTLICEAKNSPEQMPKRDTTSDQVDCLINHGPKSLNWDFRIISLLCLVIYASKP